MDVPIRVVKHQPAVGTLLAMAGGIVAASALQSMVWLAIGLTLLALVSAYVLRQNRALTMVMLLVAAFAFGAISLWCSRTCETSALARIAMFEKNGTLVYGAVTSRANSLSGEQWTVSVDSIALAPVLGEARRAIPISASLSVWVSERAMPDRLRTASEHLPNVGDYIKLYGTLEAFHAPSNIDEPAVEKMRQRQDGVSASLSLSTILDCNILHRAPRPILPIAAWLDTARGYALQAITSSVRDTNASAFVAAVVLGERAGMSQDETVDFTRAGIAHLLAISGFNVILVALVLGQLLQILGVSRLRWRMIVLMTAVFLYGTLVGYSPSVVRAVAMMELYYFAGLIERRPDTVNIIAATAAFNLLLQPNDLFLAGFQLTYGCSMALVVLTPHLYRLLLPEHWVYYSNRARAAIRVSILSLSATIASAPVIVMQFHQVSYASILTNIPAIPLASGITILGFLLIPLYTISPPIARLYGDACGIMTWGLERGAHEVARLHFVSVPARTPSWLLLIALAIAGIYVLRSATRLQAGMRLLTVGLLLLLFLWGGAPFVQPRIANARPTLKILFASVGQGDCAMLVTPHGRAYLIDTGPISLHGQASVERTVLPMLRAEGLTTIDGIFLSHMHRDHYGGMLSILKNCDVQRIYTSGERAREPMTFAMDSIVQLQGIPCETLWRGMRVALDSGVELVVLHPGVRVAKELHTHYGQHANSGSLVLAVRYGKTQVLFLGDIERSEEDRLRAVYGSDLHSAIVKVAHHGSLTSSSSLFATAVSPKYAVISVGAHNPFHHPSRGAVVTWADAGAHIWRTDRDGAALFESTGEDIQPIDWHAW